VRSLVVVDATIDVEVALLLEEVSGRLDLALECAVGAFEAAVLLPMHQTSLGEVQSGNGAVTDGLPL
jgi:hypothetical protein